jgi:hypothetical protein
MANPKKLLASAAIAAGLLGGGVVGVVLGVPGVSGAQTTTVPDSPGTTVAPTTIAAPGRTTTTRAGAARTTTTRPAATTTTAPAASGPRALAPATPGTYRYDTAGATTLAGSTIAFPAVTTLVVDAPSGTRQRATRNLRDASGNGLQTEFTLDYRPEGVFLVSLKVTTGFSGISDVRDLRPASPVLLLATGAGPGAHREADLTGNSAAKLVVDVLRKEPLTIGGQAVDTLVMRATVTLAPGDVTGRQELTVNVDPGSRLWVKERSVTDASAAGGLFTAHSEYTATMQKLTP